MFTTTDQIGKDVVHDDGAYFVTAGLSAFGMWVFADTVPNRGRWKKTFINVDHIAYVRYDLVELDNGGSFYLHPKSLEYFRMHTAYDMMKDESAVV